MSVQGTSCGKGNFGLRNIKSISIISTYFEKEATTDLDTYLYKTPQTNQPNPTQQKNTPQKTTKND